MLTDAGLKSLKPQKKLYKVVDRDGMYVVVQPSGAIVFRYDYRLNGRREALTIGRYGAADLSLARAREKHRRCETLDSGGALARSRKAARKASPQRSKELRGIRRALAARGEDGR